MGNLRDSEVRPGEAALKVRTELENHSKEGQSARVTSTILDPSGKEVGKQAPTRSPSRRAGEHTWEQEVLVKQPRLWSLEERNLYTLVTEVRAGSEAVIDTRPRSAFAASGSMPRRDSFSTTSQSS